MMTYEKIDLDDVGLVSYDFAPKCVHPDSLLHWPVFDHFHTVLEPANTFLSINPGVHVVACETLHLRVEKDHIRDPDRSDYFQTGEILRPFVKGLRVWVQRRPENLRSPIPDQISYINFVPNVAEMGGESKSPVELIAEMNNWIKEHQIPGRVVSIDTLQMRGMEAGEINVDITSWRQDNAAHVKQSFLNFFRIFYVVDPSYPPEEVGFMDIFPETLEGVGIFSWPMVERMPEVMEHVSQWTKHLPANVRLLNFQTIQCRSDYKNCLDAYKTYYWDEYFHIYHRRFLRIGYALTTEKSLSPTPPSDIKTILFAPGVIRDPHWYKWSGAYETQNTVKDRLNSWLKLTQAKLIGVETLAYKCCTGAECSEGFDAMHTWNEKGRHGVKQEQYIICLRAYVTGVPEEPKEFFWPKTLLEWERENSNTCKFC